MHNVPPKAYIFSLFFSCLKACGGAVSYSLWENEIFNYYIKLLSSCAVHSLKLSNLFFVTKLFHFEWMSLECISLLILELISDVSLHLWWKNCHRMQIVHWPETLKVPSVWLFLLFPNLLFKPYLEGQRRNTVRICSSCTNSCSSKGIFSSWKPMHLKNRYTLLLLPAATFYQTQLCTCWFLIQKPYSWS